jgi:hypothetical protein
MTSRLLNSASKAIKRPFQNAITPIIKRAESTIPYDAKVQFSAKK